MPTILDRAPQFIGPLTTEAGLELPSENEFFYSSNWWGPSGSPEVAISGSRLGTLLDLFVVSRPAFEVPEGALDLDRPDAIRPVRGFEVRARFFAAGEGTPLAYPE